jgi:hypothetical protein
LSGLDGLKGLDLEEISKDGRLRWVLGSWGINLTVSLGSSQPQLAYQLRVEVTV